MMLPKNWVDGKGKTFEHYQIMFYAITSHSFIVHKYDDFLKDKIGIEAQVLEGAEKESEKHEDVVLSKTTMSQRIMDRKNIIRAYKEIEDLVCHFMNSIGYHDVTSMMHFWRDYRRCLPYIYYREFVYIIECVNFIYHPSSYEQFDIDYVKFDKAYRTIIDNMYEIWKYIETQLQKDI